MCENIIKYLFDLVIAGGRGHELVVMRSWSCGRGHEVVMRLSSCGRDHAVRLVNATDDSTRRHRLGTRPLKKQKY